MLVVLLGKHLQEDQDMEVGYPNKDKDLLEVGRYFQEDTCFEEAGKYQYFEVGKRVHYVAKVRFDVVELDLQDYLQ